MSGNCLRTETAVNKPVYPCNKINVSLHFFFFFPFFSSFFSSSSSSSSFFFFFFPFFSFSFFSSSSSSSSFFFFFFPFFSFSFFSSSSSSSSFFFFFFSSSIVTYVVSAVNLTRLPVLNYRQFKASVNEIESISFNPSGSN